MGGCLISHTSYGWTVILGELCAVWLWLEAGSTGKGTSNPGICEGVVGLKCWPKSLEDTIFSRMEDQNVREKTCSKSSA